MELNALTRTMIDICGGLEPDKVMAAITGPDRENVFQSYVDRVGDLQYDHMREAWDYWMHKKDAGQFFTPPSIAKLAIKLCDTGSLKFRDLCAGCGSLTIEKWNQRPDCFFYCVEKDPDLIPYLLFNLCVRNMNAVVVNGDAIEGTQEAVYMLEPGQRYSSITVNPGLLSIDFEQFETVSNPPYNLKWSGSPPPLSGWPRIPKSNANFAFTLATMCRKSAVILPISDLNNNAGADAREWLVENGILEHVVALAGDMFENTPIKTCILVLSHNNQTVKFSDFTQCPGKEMRDRNGMVGGAPHENRTYHKEFNCVTDAQIAQCLNPDGVYPTKEDIRKNEYNLSPGFYRKMDTRPKPHRPYSEIAADINRINREKSLIKVTINEPYARKIGLDAIQWDGASKLDEMMERSFKAVGQEYFHRRFVTFTRSHVLKIETNDDEKWSHLFTFFLKMWTSHIYYCNEEENRLIAEMRDALMNDLLSGTLDIDKMLDGTSDDGETDTKELFPEGPDI